MTPGFIIRVSALVSAAIYLWLFLWWLSLLFFPR